ncbi:transposase family protein [Rathayibacter tanaceti]|uniref:transposase family protein n=1 Tax=Rathayibacter tanaceti TaxID=1671680 RepID=UPI001AD8048F|nr:transposase family protein [Rathayibacter tanaceti]
MLSHIIQEKEPLQVKHAAGLTYAEAKALSKRMLGEVSASGEAPDWPPTLGVFTSLVITLSYLKRNTAQVVLAEQHGVSQPTISRAIASITAWIAATLRADLPTADDLDPNGQYILDGTLLPCWSWRDRPTLWPGKHTTTGFTVQVACDLSGRLVWVSDPVDGHRHDIAVLRASGALHGLDPANWFGDKGLHRARHDHPDPHKNRPGHARMGTRIQQKRQLDPLPDLTRDSTPTTGVRYAHSGTHSQPSADSSFFIQNNTSFA